MWHLLPLLFGIEKQTWAYPTKFNEMVGHNKGKTPDDFTQAMLAMFVNIKSLKK